MGGVLAEFFLPGFGRADFPDGLHLFAAIGVLHELVVEGVAGLFVLGGPNDGFGGVGEIAAERFGGGFGLTQEMSLRSLKPSCCMAKPTEWMTWAVPETQMEPLGFNKRWQAESQAQLNS